VSVSEWSAARSTRQWLLAASLALLLSPQSADAEIVTLRWRHPTPARVTGFRVQIHAASGGAHETIDVGLPTPDAAGIFHAQIEVPDDAPSVLSVSAYDAAGIESASSNEWLRAPLEAAIGTPGRPEVVEP
jgi:hypothetical protein